MGNPLDFVLTGGQVHDATQGAVLLALTPAGVEAFIGDKGYDSDTLVQAIEARGMAAAIPPRSNRTKSRKVDWFVYKERHLIECFFNKIKQYRRIFARYEKTSRNYMGMLRFVSALIMAAVMCQQNLDVSMPDSSQRYGNSCACIKPKTTLRNSQL